MNQFAPTPTNHAKIEEALRRKFVAMFPCSAQEWHSALGEHGITIALDDYGIPRGENFLRVADPMVFAAVLYMPKEVAFKILVLGFLP